MRLPRATRRRSIPLSSARPASRRRRKVARFVAVEGLEGRTLLSGATPVPALLYDVNPATEPSNPGGLTAVGSTLFFNASEPQSGSELWKSDGTEAGTTLVKDIIPNVGIGSVPQSLTAVGNALYFTANSAPFSSNIAIWKSDGTADGTVPVVNLGFAAQPQNFTPVGTSLFYTLNSSLYRLDTVTGQSAFVRSTITSAAPAVGSVGNTLYFVSSDAVAGAELWKTDGTTEGTLRVKDINPGTGGSSPGTLTAVGSTLYFTATDGTTGVELWKSDGTEEGTVPVRDITAGAGSSSLVNLTAVGDRLFFISNGSGTEQLWVSDGTPAGTSLVTNIRTETYSGWPIELVPAGETLYFVQNDFIHGRELWKSDGTASGTSLVKNINYDSWYANPMGLTAIGDVLYFSAYHNADGDLTVQSDRELWRSDGTEEGTYRVKDINPGQNSSSPTNLKAVGGRLFFSATDDTSYNELWVSDGTEAGTHRVKDINTAGRSSVDSPPRFVAAGPLTYFAAQSHTSGVELWRTDGSAAGTGLVKDLWPGLDSSSPAELTALGETLYFAAGNGTIATTGRELYKTDGTEAGTVLVKDIYPNAFSGDPKSLKVFEGVLYFSAVDASGGRELWRSDGTDSGTYRVKDINAGSAGSEVANLTPVGDWLYFTAIDPTFGAALWKTDGTEAGTQMVRATYLSASNTIRDLTAFDGTLFFTAPPMFGPTGDRELWKSDGTWDGTVRVKDIIVGSAGSNPTNLTIAGNALYFAAEDGTSGVKLYKTDGSEAGTVRVGSVVLTFDASRARFLKAVGDTLYFSGNDYFGGWQLWKSDGTDAGTLMLKSYDRGPFDPNNAVPGLTAIGSTLYFSAYDSTAGIELWKSDGTVAGTVRVEDIRPGTTSSAPGSLTPIGTRLYFAASTDGYGREPWYLDVTPPNQAPTAGTVALSPSAPTAGQSITASPAGFADPDGDALSYSYTWHVVRAGSGDVIVSDGASSTLGYATKEGDTVYVVARATDPGGASVTATSAGIVVVNGAPTAAAGGPYTVQEGGGVALSGAGSSDPDQSTASLVFEWDLDDDGLYDDATGVAPSFLAGALARGTTRMIALRVTDSGGLTSAATTTVTVVNAPPTPTATGPVSGVVGQVLSFTLGAGDSPADVGAGFAYEIDWEGDGVVDEAIPRTVGPVSLSHAFAAAESYSTRVTAIDVAGAMGTVTLPVTIAEASSAAVVDTVQQIVGALPPSGSGTVSFQTTPSGASELIEAVNALTPPEGGRSVEVVLDLGAGTYSGQTVSPPAGVTLVINGAGGQVVFVGASPALTVTSGTVVITGAAFTNATDAPTILVTGGHLTLRDSTVEESTGFDQVAVLVTGGTVDLGTPTDPGLNIVNVNGVGELARNTSGRPISASGTALTIDGSSAISSLSGLVFADFNADGQVDFGERGIAGVVITLGGTDVLGNPAHFTITTDADGAYVFPGLLPGRYTISEAQPAGYTQGTNTVGTGGGTVAGDQFDLQLAASHDALNYNFGERPPAGGAIAKGQAAGIGFWNNKQGQALIRSLNGAGSSTRLGDWLAATLPNMFGASSGNNNLAGRDNTAVASFFQSRFVLKGEKLDAQVLATALAVYVTNATLNDTGAGKDLGFIVEGDGVGTATFDVGTNGTAFGVADGTVMTVMDLLMAVEEQAVDGALYGGDAVKRKKANAVFGAINQSGGL